MAKPTPSARPLRAALSEFGLHDVFVLFEPNGEHGSLVGLPAAAPGTATGLAESIHNLLLTGRILIACATGCAIDKVCRGQTPKPKATMPRWW